MAVELVTKQDLLDIREELAEIKAILMGQRTEDKPLKSGQVKDILQCSDSTLQKHRISGRLPFQKTGGTYYYNLSDVKSLFQNSIKDF